MADTNYVELQRRYGGRYVARRGAQVVASAGSYDELSDQLKAAAIDLLGLIIEYVEPADSVSVY